MNLAEALERFNRKERNLLIRDILERQSEFPPPLARNFCERLAEIVGGIPPKTLQGAWWATDFHFDWLAGALLTFMKGEEDLTGQDNKSALVKGTQEDIDLVVVAHDPAEEMLSHLILIEVKAYGHFSNKQHRSKVDRLRLLYGFYESLKTQSPHRISFHYVLCSPHEPIKLDLLPLPWHSHDAPKTKHLHLKLNLSRDYTLSVTGGKKDWKCVRKSRRPKASSARIESPSNKR